VQINWEQGNQCFEYAYLGSSDGHNNDCTYLSNPQLTRERDFMYN
jgi:hypothetical protein